MRDVLLVCMPFGPVFRPAIGLSLLRAGLARHDISCRVRYFTIDFAERIGQTLYCDIAFDKGPPVDRLTGDWIFSGALNGVSRAADDRYVDEILVGGLEWRENRAPRSPSFVKRILDARRKVSAFLDRCLEEVLREQPKIVGFSSMFQQHTASLALARAVKRERPDMLIVFGGANCEGVMGAEALRQFPFIDAVVSGEGDIVFPELVRRALASQCLTGLEGVRTRDTIEAEFLTGRFTNAPMVQNLDDLPWPDYGDYFEQFRASRYNRVWQPSVPFETSRGCWWGERSQCTFCGLNDASLPFRRKSAKRAFEEVQGLVARYPGCDLEAVDNILDLRSFSEFVPLLSTLPIEDDIVYETKSNLKKRQVRMLRDAGVRCIQPGIESFSDAVLRLMRKGVTGLQNIQLLKWCKELGIKADWNLLWGFPDEPPEEYERMAALVPLLAHLQPPICAAPFRLDRFSPIYRNGEGAGITGVRPVPSYRHVHSLPAAAISNIAYYFTFRYRQPRLVDGYVACLREEVRKWKKSAKRSDLFFVDLGERLVMWDLRPAFETPITVLDGLDRQLYLACDGICHLRGAVEVCGKAEASCNAGNAQTSPRVEEDVRARLDSFVARGLALGQDSRYLALAVPLGEYSPASDITGEVYRLARLLGEHRADAWVIPLDSLADRQWRLRRLKRARGSGSTRPRRSRDERLTPDRFSITDRGELAIR